MLGNGRKYCIQGLFGNRINLTGMESYKKWVLGRFQDLNWQRSKVAATGNQRSRLSFQETHVTRCQPDRLQGS